LYPPIAITAIGTVLPVGVDLDDLLETLTSNSDMPNPIPLEDFFQISTHSLCEIGPSDLKIHPKEARIMDKHSLMLLKASEEAYGQSGLSSYDAEDRGLFAALGMVDYRIEDLLPAVKKSINGGILDYRTFFKKGYQEIYPLWPLSMLNNIALCQVAIRLSIRGENAVFSPHSDASLWAVHEAAMALARGHCRGALSGGVSEVVSLNSLIRYVLSNTNHSRLMGQAIYEAVPYKMAEGSAILAIERLCDANQRGAIPIAMIAGFGSAFGFDDTHAGPTMEAIKQSMQVALKAAGIGPSEVDVLFSHHDQRIPEGVNEKAAIDSLFAKAMTVCCTKPKVGDMLSGAGAFDIALAVAMLQSKKLGYALINAFSVEGNVASMVLRGVGQ
jgi:3-oxoacyl-[acyl-carrier-protein] synthase II